MAQLLSRVTVLVLLVATSVMVTVSASEMFRARGQKNYSEEEEGKLLPTRTFLTPLEIVLLCVLVVVMVFLIVFCVIYVYCFGCVLPKCCRSEFWNRNSHEIDEDESQAQLYRERRIGEIWKHNETK